MVLISGPIASGKSTLAAGTARRLRARGHTADYVVVEGTETPEEASGVLGRVPSGVPVLGVLLVADYARALDRARTEPSRGRSQDPVFLRAMYDRHEATAAGLPQALRLRVEEHSPDELADQVVAALTGRE